MHSRSRHSGTGRAVCAILALNAACRRSLWPYFGQWFRRTTGALLTRCKVLRFMVVLYGGDDPVIVLADPIAVLAHLQPGRAYAVSGDSINAKSACQEFLTDWKDADPDIPVLKQASAEYAKLYSSD